jgi:hypothetical protein
VICFGLGHEREAIIASVAKGYDLSDGAATAVVDKAAKRHEDRLDREAVESEHLTED